MFINRENWRSFWKDVHDFDEKISHTNPFSEENYANKKYTNFREFYSPKPQHVVIWVDED